MSNPTILKWLREGKFYEALTGKNGYFMANHTYRGHHDLGLVISTMFELAKDEHEIVSRKFNEAVRVICKEDILIFLDTINVYLITKKVIKETLSINIEDYAELLSHTKIDPNKYSDEDKYQINCLLKALKKKVSAFENIELPL